MSGKFDPSIVKHHPLAALFPLLEGQPLQDLADDIKAHGLREPIVLLDERILDGRNRHLACLSAGVEPEFEVYEGDDPVSYVISRNLHRRHLDASQRAAVSARLADMQQGARTDLQPSANLRKVSQEEAARLLNVSVRSVQSAQTVLDRGITEIVAKLDAGKISVSAASKVAKLPAPQQHDIASKDDEELRAKLRELSVAAQRHKAKLDTLPSKEEALAISKTSGNLVRANDGKLHVYVPQEEREQFAIWLSIKPHVEAIAETVHTPQQFADSADAFWLPKFPDVLDQVIKFLTEAKQLMEVRHGASKIAAE